NHGRQERKFWMQRRSAKNRHSNARTPAETKIRELSGRKSPQKRPIWRCAGNARFARTGWWRHSGTNWRPTTQSSNRSLKSESGTEFFDAETEGQIRLFCLAETDAETGRYRKSPLSAGQMRGSPAESDT